MNDPFFKYTRQERQNMSLDEWLLLLEESNKYVREKYKKLRESNFKTPQFNTIEELRAYYHCRPLDEAINNWNKLFDD